MSHLETGKPPAMKRLALPGESTIHHPDLAHRVIGEIAKGPIARLAVGGRRAEGGTDGQVRSVEGHMMRIQQRQADCSFDLWTREGSWFWLISSSSNSRRIVGAAPSAEAAAHDACETLGEIEPGNSVVPIVPALLESALTWSGVIERFARALGTVSARC
ncbi:MAG: hypothetical protein ACREQT_02785 [Candidatus Binataceae bacterium]